MERREALRGSLRADVAFADEASLRAFAEALGRCLSGGETLGLIGTLGAGKTAFTQSLARGLGVPARFSVISPTFVLHRRYRGRVTLDHLDAYRLGGAAEFEALGSGELFEGGGVVVIEWADLVADALPAHAITIRFDVTGASSRRLTVEVPDQAALPPGTAERLRELLISHP